jgi:hypothetical protein
MGFFLESLELQDSSSTLDVDVDQSNNSSDSKKN